MPDFTHTYNFNFDNFTLTGEAEFNTDGKSEFSIDSHPEALDSSKIAEFQRLLNLLVEFSSNFGELKELQFSEKE